jgi:hypothetical protein
MTRNRDCADLPVQNFFMASRCDTRLKVVAENGLQPCNDLSLDGLLRLQHLSASMVILNVWYIIQAFHIILHVTYSIQVDWQ